MEAHAEVVSAPESMCTLGDHHPGEPAIAEVCKGCYERLQERLDVCEAALHLDIKEAAQIIYDAVWADPSDPNKTYQNAANALLSELRKRSGMNSLHGPFHPLSCTRTGRRSATVLRRQRYSALISTHFFPA